MTVLKKVPVDVDTLPDRLSIEEGGHLVHAVQLDLGEARVALTFPRHLLHHRDKGWEII